MSDRVGERHRYAVVEAVNNHPRDDAVGALAQVTEPDPEHEEREDRGRKAVHERPGERRDGDRGRSPERREEAEAEAANEQLLGERSEHGEDEHAGDEGSGPPGLPVPAQDLLVAPRVAAEAVHDETRHESRPDGEQSQRGYLAPRDPRRAEGAKLRAPV